MDFDLLRLVNELERDESLRLKPYRDNGPKKKLTIGIGRNLEDVGITKGEAYVMCHNDIERCVIDLNTRLPWWQELDDVRQRVLLNMTFNMGIKDVLEFKKTILLIQGGNYSKAAEEMLRSEWAQEVGSRACRLSKMMANGSMLTKP